MEHDLLEWTDVKRDKLGLALSGGGFRASLFHLGVLRRMAELDLLRRVEVLSTVSGGSIIGALYVLLLKRELEKAEDGDLTRDQYIGIIDELEDHLVGGIAKNPRTRLVMNPLGVLRVLLTPDSLGKRMARIYERYIYAEVVQDIEPRSWLGRRLRPGRLRLKDLRINPGGETTERAGIEEYNKKAVEARRSVATRLVLNATSLNSGARFWFSSSEVGDWYLGHVRHSEIETLRERKKWLEQGVDGLDRMLAETDDPDRRLALSLTRWWVARKGSREKGSGQGEEAGNPAPTESREAADAGGLEEGGTVPPGGGWDALVRHGVFESALVDAEAGLLRRAKVPAWYLVCGLHRSPPVEGGRDPLGHWIAFREAVRAIDPGLGRALEEHGSDDPALSDQLLDFVLELYAIRSADIVAHRVGRFWAETTVGEAVGASACFPPVFPPLQVLGLYDDLHVSRLGLTDGGVFDNMGLTALLDEGCTQIIASDTSGLFEDRERVSAGRLTMMTRIVSVLMKVVASGQRDRLREKRRVSRQVEPYAKTDPDWKQFLVSRKLTDLAYFHIVSEPVDPRDASGAYVASPGSFDREQRRALARLRTDLDAFGELEVAALVDHGYEMADAYIRRYFRPTEAEEPIWRRATPETPRPIEVERKVLDRVLEAGASRFFRALRVRAPLSWAFTLAAAVAILGLTWNVRTSVRDVVGAIGNAVVSALHRMAPWLEPEWTEQTFSVGAFAAGAVLLLVILPRLLGISITKWLDAGTRARRLARRLATAGKWGRSLAGNLLWLFGALPVVLALGAAVLGWVSHLLFSRPYLWATRNRARD